VIDVFFFKQKISNTSEICCALVAIQFNDIKDLVHFIAQVFLAESDILG